MVAESVSVEMQQYTNSGMPHSEMTVLISAISFNI
jgi:hypothetical protein